MCKEMLSSVAQCLRNHRRCDQHMQISKRKIAKSDLDLQHFDSKTGWVFSGDNDLNQTKPCVCVIFFSLPRINLMIAYRKENISSIVFDTLLSMPVQKRYTETGRNGKGAACEHVETVHNLSRS